MKPPDDLDGDGDGDAAPRSVALRDADDDDDDDETSGWFSSSSYSPLIGSSIGASIWRGEAILSCEVVVVVV